MPLLQSCTVVWGKLPSSGADPGFCEEGFESRVPKAQQAIGRSEGMFPRKVSNLEHQRRHFLGFQGEFEEKDRSPPPTPPTPLRSATAYVHFPFWYQGQTIISWPVSKNFHLPFLKPALLCILNTPADRTQISLQLHNIIHCPRQGLVCPELNRKMRDPESRACLLKGLDKTAADPYVLVIPILQRTSLLLQFHGW